MPNPNPHEARKARARRRAADLQDARGELWRAAVVARDIMDEARERGDDSLALTAVTRVTQAVQAYGKLYEQIELQAEIEELRADIESMRRAA